MIYDLSEKTDTTTRDAYCRKVSLTKGLPQTLTFGITLIRYII